MPVQDNDNNSLSTGWASRFDIAAKTAHRIILHGNIQDTVLVQGPDGSTPRPLVDWVVRKMESEYGFTKVLHYDFQSPPRILSWDHGDSEENPTDSEILVSFLPDHQNVENPALQKPEIALSLLSEFLKQSNENSAVIIENAELCISYPGDLAASLHALTWSGNDRVGLAIHLYQNQSLIPQAFIQTDPSASLISVAVPGFPERRAFMESLAGSSNLRNTTVRNQRVSPEILARVTQGYRMSELVQLEGMARQHNPGFDLNDLLVQFRFGRIHDYWASVDVGQVATTLNENLKGQSEPIEQIVNLIYSSKHHFGDLLSPPLLAPALTVFAVGPTGTGKTFMARLLALNITGNEENMKRFDMSEFGQEHSDQRLIGSPPGYVGHQQGGELTNHVQQNPFSVVLIDEIEKSCDKIIDIFLQILEGARLTDGKGETVDFSQTILIFTSNIGTQEAIEEKLVNEDRAERDKHFREAVEEHCQEDLMRPELFGRLKSGIVVFNYIKKEIAEGVIISKLKEVAEGITERLDIDLDFVFDPENNPGDQKVVEEFLARTSFEEYGLREVNNQLLQLVAPASGRFMDDVQPGGRVGFEWCEREQCVSIRYFADNEAGR